MRFKTGDTYAYVKGDVELRWTRADDGTWTNVRTGPSGNVSHTSTTLTDSKMETHLQYLLDGGKGSCWVFGRKGQTS